jgi:CzcA family heavy metal efflux pump
MLDSIIRFSLNHRSFTFFLAVVAAIAGWRAVQSSGVDVFPDLNRPTVAIMTEAAGLAPEEVEALVTRPIELVMVGATGVQRVRSSSALGLSIVWVEFDWGTDIFIDRQVVTERLQLARSRLPQGINPVMAPISSIMGEVMLIGLRSTREEADREAAKETAMLLRTIGEFNLRNRLLAVPGVSQVSVMGGILKQYQIITSPERLLSQNITLDQLVDAAQRASVLAGGGVMQRETRESVIRIQGQALTLQQILESPIVLRDPIPVRIGDVADVRFDGPVRRGDAGSWVRDTSVTPSRFVGGPAVILAVQKQPQVDTVQLDREIDRALAEMRTELPAHVVIDDQIFRQSRFIRAAVENVLDSIQEAAVWVVIVLMLLLGNARTSISSLISMPMSILLTFLVFEWLGIGVNTMTLGGIAVAIGDLVDDSIVDIENIYRRLKENFALPTENRRAIWDVVYAASCEVRNSIVYATAIVVLVVLPLFSLTGIEGRLFAPLGFAYLISLCCSLTVSLTLTPVLGYWLLPSDRFLSHAKEPWLTRLLKQLMSRVLHWTLPRATWILAAVLLFVVCACVSILGMGGEFLPEFNEGTFTVSLRLEPGTSLGESSRVASQVEKELFEIPEVEFVARRTGRAELDEHAEGVHSSEIDVGLYPHLVPKESGIWRWLAWLPLPKSWSHESRGRSMPEVAEEIRDRISYLPGVAVNVGQPISHRIDHMMSGIRAQVAVKIYGSDLQRLRQLGYEIEFAMRSIQGVVDLQVEPQVEVSQVRMQIRREIASRHGLAPSDIAKWLETAYQGKVLAQILDGDRFHGLVVWYDEASRRDPQTVNDTVIETPSGRRLSLGQLVEIVDTTGPNMLNREDGQRRFVVYCNVQNRDLARAVGDIESAIAPIRDQLKREDAGYRIELSGQFEAQQEANRKLILFGILSIVGILFLLQKAVKSWTAALQILVNVPLAALGSVALLLIVNRPDWSQLAAEPVYRWPLVWTSATTLSVAHLVGFITLIGIVCRNGILMVAHYIQLIEVEGQPFSKETIIRGSLDRLPPVLMTAMTSFIGLAPLLFSVGEPGKEILHPLALVVFGGMLSSTLLDQLVTPALFYRFSARKYLKQPPAVNPPTSE